MTAVRRLVLYFKFELVFPFGGSLLPCSLILIWSFSNLEGKVFHLVLITFNDEYGGLLILMRVIVYTPPSRTDGVSEEPWQLFTAIHDE